MVKFYQTFLQMEFTSPEQVNTSFPGVSAQQAQKEAQGRPEVGNVPKTPTQKKALSTPVGLHRQ